MRPHIEHVSVHDLVWHPAELPRGDGAARQQNLSYDEENGAASTRVMFDTRWRRPGGYHEADTEWYVLSGRVRLGDHELGDGDYWRAPAGLRVPELDVAAGSEVLIFREFGAYGFSVSNSDRDGWIAKGGNSISSLPGELTIVPAGSTGWSGNIFDGTAEIRKLELQILYKDFGDDPDHPGAGWFTNLVRVPPGKVGTLIEHHQVAEEAYSLVGRMTYNYGVFMPGSYFYRPPSLRHAFLCDSGGMGYVFLMRVNGHISNWNSENVSFEVGGEALNYDAADPAQRPVTAGLPVRSRTLGSWDGRGR